MSNYKTLQEQKDRYHKLYTIIFKYGLSKPKKHGNWILLHLFDNYYLQLDTWNRSISMFNGNPEYEFYTGFKQKVESFYKYLGIDFGGFSNDPFWVTYCLAHLQHLKT